MQHPISKRGNLLRAFAVAALVVGAVVSTAFDGALADQGSAARSPATAAPASVAGARATRSPAGPRIGVTAFAAGVFAGTWRVHSNDLVIGLYGTGTAEWRGLRVVRHGDAARFPAL